MRHQPSTQVLVTGRLWLGAGGASSIGSALIDLLESAKQEVIIVAYRLTTAISDFTESLEKCLARGCYVRIVLDQGPERNETEAAYFSRLLRDYKTLAVWDFREAASTIANPALHAKLLVVDRKSAIVGSANFSRNGMLENHEISVRVHGDEARTLAETCDRLVENGQREGILTQRRKNGT